VIQFEIYIKETGTQKLDAREQMTSAVCIAFLM